MQTIRVKDSSSLEEAAGLFIDDVESWIAQCIDDYTDESPTDVHDQGTFTISWLPVIQAHANDEAVTFLKSTRDRIAEHFAATDQWHHGYWRRQEIHHGTEHFELFLGTLCRLDPSDERSVSQLVDAAEHLGNWVPGIPDWYNWDQHRFVSMYFGTEEVREETEVCINVPDHFRGISIALLAWEFTGELRYLDFAKDAAEPWVKAILGSGELPAGLGPKEAIYDLSDNATYRGFAGMAPATSTEIDKAENLLASAAPNALLRLFEATAEPKYRESVERILDVLTTQFLDPDAGAAIDVHRRYFNATRDSRYIDRVKSGMAACNPMGFEKIGIELPERQKGRPRGIGKRGDKPSWFEDKRPRRHSPVLLAHVAELSGDEVLAARALDLGRAYFDLARKVFPDGREHGCSSRTVSAIARGHGRENNTGVVTGVLAPILEHFNLAVS